LGDVFAIQEDIAMAVASELSVSLGLNEDGRLLGGTDNLDAYEFYLAALESNGTQSSFGSLRTVELVDAAIRLDSDFALAWSLKSSAHSNRVQVIPTEQVTQQQEAAEQAALRAIELEPNLGVAYAQLGYAFSQREKWIEAERAYRRAEELGFANTGGSAYGILLMATGHFARAHEVHSVGRDIDPLNPVLRAFLVASQGLDGAFDEAYEELERGRIVYDNFALGESFAFWFKLAAGEIDSGDEIVLSGPIMDAVKTHFGTPAQAVAVLRELYLDDAYTDQALRTQIAIFAGYFGAPEFAFEVIKELVARNTQNLYAVWFPQMSMVRQLPEFEALIREVGFVDYWDEFGWPDICRPQDTGEFECG
jgi:tetratricopeptide (TPR) repeat protein